jgi:hypothetical protein
MEFTPQEIQNQLLKIYNKYKRLYKLNPDSKQLCCMWSTTNPPDIIEDTPPFQDMENVFDISIGDDDCLKLYDMEIDDAVKKIAEMIKQQRAHGRIDPD